MDGVMRALGKKKTHWKHPLFFAVKLAQQTLSKYYGEVTPTTGILLISAHILDSFRKLRSLGKWDKRINLNPKDKRSYTTQYQEAFVKYLENEYCAKLRRVPVDKHESLPSCNLVASATASGSCQLSCNTYDLSSDVQEYSMTNNVAKTTPGPSNRAACLSTTDRLYLNCKLEAPKRWGPLNQNLND